MCILDLLSAILSFCRCRYIILSVILFNIFLRHDLCFCRYSGGIGTQIGDHTHSTAALDINSFIELLCQAHRLLCGKIQHLAGLLLQGRCGKGKRRFLYTLSLFHFAYLKLCILQLCHDLIQLFSGGNVYLTVFRAIIFSDQRLLFSFYEKRCIQCPVLFRNKIVDLILSVTDDAQCH